MLIDCLNKCDIVTLNEVSYNKMIIKGIKFISRLIKKTISYYCYTKNDIKYINKGSYLAENYDADEELYRKDDVNEN